MAELLFMKRFWWSSFLLHSLLLLGLFWQTVGREPLLSEQAQDFTPIELVEVAAKNKTQTAQKLPPKKIQPQIVDQAEQAINQEVPVETRFLSQNNQVVKKQTIAKNRGEFKNSEKLAATDQQKKQAQRFNPASQWQANDGWKLQSASEKHSIEAAKELPVKDKSNEGSASLDYIEELDSGLETLLTTKEFVYYTFFKRMRNQLNPHWTPLVKTSVAEVYRKGRRLASSTSVITRTVVILDEQGSLIKVQVIGNSGFKELDQAALQALKSAGPFRNPPKGMRDPDGLVRIRWDFVIEG